MMEMSVSTICFFLKQPSTLTVVYYIHFFLLSIVQAVFFNQNWLYLTLIPINIRAFMDYIENSDIIELDDLSYKFKICYFIL